MAGRKGERMGIDSTESAAEDRRWRSSQDYPAEGEGFQAANFLR